MTKYFKEIERNVLLSGEVRSSVRLRGEVLSYDDKVNRFIFPLYDSHGEKLDLAGAIARSVLTYRKPDNDFDSRFLDNATIETINDVPSICYEINKSMKGFVGRVGLSMYIEFESKQRMDVLETYFDMRMSEIDIITNDVPDFYIEDFEKALKRVEDARDETIADINKVLPDVQSKVTQLNTELAVIDAKLDNAKPILDKVDTLPTQSSVDALAQSIADNQVLKDVNDSVNFENLSPFVDLARKKSTIIRNSIITGYDTTTKLPVIASNGNFSILKITLPEYGVITVPYATAFESMTFGQFIFVSDSDDKYTYMQNGRPLNVNRTGWTQNSDKSITIDRAVAPKIDSYLFLSIPNNLLAIYRVLATKSVKLSEFAMIAPESIGNDPSVSLILPSTYPVVVSETMYISLSAILDGRNVYKEPFEYMSTNDTLDWMSVVNQASNSPVNTAVRGYLDGKLLFNQSIATTPVTKSVSGNKNVMMIGESTTFALNFMQAFADKFKNDPLSVNLIGQKRTDYPCEGYAGWTTSDILTKQNYKSVDNSFYNPTTKTFDYAYYKATFNTPTLDYVFINFGINDADQSVALATTLANIKKMITSIKSVDANCKFLIGLTNNYSRHENYQVAYIYDRYKKIQDIHKALLKEYDRKESQGYFVVPYYLNIDPVWDMQWETVATNVLNTRRQVVRGADNVHPGLIGYQKTAQVAYNCLKYAVSLESK